MSMYILPSTSHTLYGKSSHNPIVDMYIYIKLVYVLCSFCGVEDDWKRVIAGRIHLSGVDRKKPVMNSRTCAHYTRVRGE